MWYTTIEYTGKDNIIPDTMKLQKQERLIDAISQVTEGLSVIFTNVIDKITLASVSGSKKTISFGIYDSKGNYFAHGTIRRKD